MTMIYSPNGSKRILVIAAFLAFLAAATPAFAARIYIANDDHTDYMWSTDEAGYRAAFLGQLDYYLGRIDATLSEQTKNQARFSADGTFWVWEYEKNKSPAEFSHLIGHIQDGHITVPMNALVTCYGGQPAEAVLRGFYYAGDLERRFGLRFRMAQAMENQTMPFGVAGLWAGAGAKYCWQGQCGCATRVPNPYADRPHEMYWWEGLDGSRILTKWYRLEGNQNFGGYAEVNQGDSPGIDLDPLRNKAQSPGYPYDIVGAFGKGWDFVYPDHPNSTATTQFESAAQANSDVYSSSAADFFEDFEAAYGAALPTYSATFGNEWDLLCASLAEVSARVKRAVEKLRSAEAMATLVSLEDPGFMAGRETARARAWMDLGLYFEHDWTGDGAVPREERAEWQRARLTSIEDYVDTLYQDAVEALAGMIRKSGSNLRFFAFNPLSWERTDIAEVAYADTNPFHVVDLTAGQETPSQIVMVDGERRLRVLARRVPSIGYKVFEVRAGAGQSFADAATATGGDSGTLENQYYRVTVSNSGAITSLIDKTRGDHEFVRTAMNGLGIGWAAVTVGDRGPVSVTLFAAGTEPSHHSRITFIRDSERIEIRNEIMENFSDVKRWEFGFNLASPDIRYEEVGAVIRAKTLTEGGHYCPDPEITRYDWQTLNHFADISGDGPIGVNLSNADCYFMQVGSSTVNWLDTTTPAISILAGGQVDGTSLGIQNQDGDSYFRQRFALRTHDAYGETEAMKFALEHQNPLVAAVVTGGSVYPANDYSLLSISNQSVLAWAVKPAEDGIATAGVIVRLWNFGDGSSFSLSFPGRVIASARRTTHLETPLEDVPVTSGILAASIAGKQMLTFSLLSLPSPYGGLNRLVMGGSDFDGDGRAEIAIFRPSSGLWAVRSLTRIYFGTDGDLPASGDYNGDGTDDFALFRPSSGLWALRNLSRIYFGSSSDLAAPVDYDGDGRTDPALFRPASGLWAVKDLSRSYFGSFGDTPLPDDYSGDGSGDMAVFRSSGLWAIKNLSRFYFGASDDVAVPGDYRGEGKAGAAVFRSSAGLWAIREMTRLYFGGSLDDPLPADYDGDAIVAPGIFRESTGLWAAKGLTRIYFGQSGDIPITR